MKGATVGGGYVETAMAWVHGYTGTSGNYNVPLIRWYTIQYFCLVIQWDSEYYNVGKVTSTLPNTEDGSNEIKTR